MLMIPVTPRGGTKPIYINADHIEMVRETIHGELGTSCIYMLGDTDPYVVQETLGQLLSMLPSRLGPS